MLDKIIGLCLNTIDEIDGPGANDKENLVEIIKTLVVALLGWFCVFGLTWEFLVKEILLAFQINPFLGVSKNLLISLIGILLWHDYKREVQIYPEESTYKLISCSTDILVLSALFYVMS